MLTIKAKSNNVHARDTPLREIPQTKIFVRDRLRDKIYVGRSQHTHSHTHVCTATLACTKTEYNNNNMIFYNEMTVFGPGAPLSAGTPYYVYNIIAIIKRLLSLSLSLLLLLLLLLII